MTGLPPDPAPQDGRLFYPATARNRAPILEVLRAHLPARGRVLEIASGSGEHVIHFARALPGLTFCPSDPDDRARASIDAWAAREGCANICPARALDVEDRAAWPQQPFSAVLCINMIHIAPWSAAQALIACAGDIVTPDGLLYLYGPYKRAGQHTAPSNAEFDASLRARNPAWGVRDLEAVAALAQAAGFAAPEVVAMPANNFSVIFKRHRA